jgi:hypothetical protein
MSRRVILWCVEEYFGMRSSPFLLYLETGERGGIGRRTRLRIWRRKASEFESRRSHEQRQNSYLEELRRALRALAVRFWDQGWMAALCDATQ